MVSWLLILNHVLTHELFWWEIIQYKIRPDAQGVALEEPSR